jgi:hypothetical protein
VGCGYFLRVALACKPFGFQLGWIRSLPDEASGGAWVGGFTQDLSDIHQFLIKAG